MSDHRTVGLLYNFVKKGPKLSHNPRFRVFSWASFDKPASSTAWLSSNCSEYLTLQHKLSMNGRWTMQSPSTLAFGGVYYITIGSTLVFLWKWGAKTQHPKIKTFWLKISISGCQAIQSSCTLAIGGLSGYRTVKTPDLFVQLSKSTSPQTCSL